MQLVVNGAPCQIADGISLAELVPTISDRLSGIAVAHNGEVVPKGSWAWVLFADGDLVDVVTAVQGG